MLGPVFLATPIGMNTGSAFTHARYLEDRWGVTVCQAKDVFEDKFKDIGGWSGYASYVGGGVDYNSRVPIFATICCVQRQVGRATGQIVETALEVGKEVFALLIQEDKAHLYSVYRFSSVDPENWKSGWALELTEIKEKDCD
jgi:hypothetical protein